MKEQEQQQQLSFGFVEAAASVGKVLKKTVAQHSLSHVDDITAGLNYLLLFESSGYSHFPFPKPTSFSKKIHYQRSNKKREISGGQDNW